MTVSHIINLLTQHSYWFLFLIVFIEGPITTFIAGSLTALGHFNFWWVYLIVAVADIIGDNILYGMGRFGRKGAQTRLGRWVGLTPARLVSIEKIIAKHPTGFLVIGKLAGTGHELGGPFIVTAGIAKVPYGRFVATCSLLTLAKSLAILSLGYYFGGMANHISSFSRYADLILFVAFIVFGFMYGRRYLKSVA